MKKLVETSEVIIFTKLLDGGNTFQCICEHYFRGRLGGYCTSCDRPQFSNCTKPCSIEEYRTSKAD